MFPLPLTSPVPLHGQNGLQRAEFKKAYSERWTCRLISRL